MSEEDERYMLKKRITDALKTHDFKTVDSIQRELYPPIKVTEEDYLINAGESLDRRYKGAVFSIKKSV